jgi:hypothetical protein
MIADHAGRIIDIAAMASSLNFPACSAQLNAQ